MADKNIAVFSEMIGTSPAMRGVQWRIKKFADLDCNVVILGESGTGKELVARAIHESSFRRNRPFVPVDCTTTPASLFESEFFGHVRGAFTGADQTRMGALQSAQNGTAFLDEIGELSLDLQGKLLRVMQEKTVRPVGGNEPITLKCRFVAATNRDLESLVGEQTFRLDLYFRLMIGEIRVPSLRDRKEDIPLLVAHFLEQSNASARAQCTISESAMEAISRYSWPGNIRQLENAIRRAVILADTDTIEISDFPNEVVGNSEKPILRSPEHELDMNVIEQLTIEKALCLAGGDKIAAAKLLGMGKTTLYRKLKKMREVKTKTMTASAGG